MEAASVTAEVDSMKNNFELINEMIFGGKFTNIKNIQ